MEKIQDFIKVNKAIFFAMIIGLILGYIHWFFWGCYWGTYPMSAEMWFNCTIGSLFSGFIGSLFKYENPI